MVSLLINEDAELWSTRRVMRLRISQRANQLTQMQPNAPNVVFIVHSFRASSKAIPLRRILKRLYDTADYAVLPHYYSERHQRVTCAPAFVFTGLYFVSIMCKAFLLRYEVYIA